MCLFRGNIKKRFSVKFFSKNSSLFEKRKRVMNKSLELSAQAPQATTDLHRISLGLESGLSDQLVYSLCCFDSCMIEGLVNPVKDAGLWNRCETAVINLMQSCSSGPVLLHALHTLSFALQLSDPESDTVVPRLIDILLGEFSLKERQLALRCLSVLELDSSETSHFQTALLLVLEFTSTQEESADLVTLVIALMSRHISDYSSVVIDTRIIPQLLLRLEPSASGSKLTLSCIGLVHYILESRSSSAANLIVASLINRLHNCGCKSACETCQGCLSCILRIGVDPAMRETMRPYIDVLISIAWNWQSGGHIAAQSLLNLMAGLLH